MKQIVLFFLILILAGALFTACSQSNKVGLTVQDAWARPGQAGGTTAIYFTIDNHGGPEDVLKDVECASGEMAQLHKTEKDSAGVMKMVHQPQVAVPAGENLSFAPGGLHVMVMNLKNDIKPGEKLAFTLHFDKAGAVQLEAPVREP